MPPPRIDDLWLDEKIDSLQSASAGNAPRGVSARDSPVDVLASERLRRGYSGRRFVPPVVYLPPKPFELLLHLLQNRGRVLSKDELLEAVWRT